MFEPVRGKRLVRSTTKAKNIFSANKQSNYKRKLSRCERSSLFGDLNIVFGGGLSPEGRLSPAVPFITMVVHYELETIFKHAPNFVARFK